MKDLIKLKQQILPLKDFFTSILGEIRENTDQDLEKFLRPIENSKNASGNEEQAYMIKLNMRSKKINTEMYWNTFCARVERVSLIHSL